MRSRRLLPVLFAIGSGLLPIPLAAQVKPVTAPFWLTERYDAPEGRIVSQRPRAAALNQGRFAAAWETVADHQKFAPVYWDFSVSARVLTSSGSLEAEALLSSGEGSSDYIPGGPALAAHGAGGFLTFWNEVLDIYGTRWAPEEAWQGSLSLDEERQGERTVDNAVVGANGAGDYAVAFEACDWNGQHCQVVVRTFPADPALCCARIVLAPQTPGRGELVQPGLGMDSLGRFVVLWKQFDPGSYQGSLWGRRFARNGKPLGPRFRIASPVSRWSWKDVRLAMSPGGAFAVAWTVPDPAALQVRVRSYSSAAVPAAGLELSFPGTLQDLATDRRGNLALAYQDTKRQRIRFFNQHLVPQGPPLTAPAAAVALGDTGRLLTIWSGGGAPTPSGAWQYPLLAKLWQVPHDADACVYRGARFLCDTAGDGKNAEETIAFGLGAPTDVPLLADFDGDGRADPCVFRSGVFHCDTAHDGGAAEARARFGLAGDRPLLADVDGDGRADPCVWRQGTFLCDTNRDGTADVQIAFGRPDDVPLLADANGDHRADPCVERAGLTVCDTAHDGGTAEQIFDLNPALAGVGSGVPLLGDVDGDGRADPCLWSAGRLICGFFNANGGVPQSVRELRFGQPGDLPLLGDLDAF